MDDLFDKIFYKLGLKKRPEGYVELVEFKRKIYRDDDGPSYMLRYEPEYDINVEKWRIIEITTFMGIFPNEMGWFIGEPFDSKKEVMDYIKENLKQNE